MRIEIQIGGRSRTVELEREGSRLRARIDGREVEADATEIAPGSYSILLSGRALEVRVWPGADGLVVESGGCEMPARVLDPRAWRGRHGHAIEAEGRQSVVAPMPGKIVRVLVKTGDRIEAGQGLVVVEAMKMQNEVKSPKSGTVEKISVSEGQTVNAGETIVIVA